MQNSVQIGLNWNCQLELSLAKTRKIPNQQKISFMFGFAKGDISLTKNMQFNTKSPLYKFGFAVKHLTLHNLSIKQNNFKELNLCEKS